MIVLFYILLLRAATDSVLQTSFGTSGIEDVATPTAALLTAVNGSIAPSSSVGDTLSVGEKASVTKDSTTRTQTTLPIETDSVILPSFSSETKTLPSSTLSSVTNTNTPTSEALSSTVISLSPEVPVSVSSTVLPQINSSITVIPKPTTVSKKVSSVPVSKVITKPLHSTVLAKSCCDDGYLLDSEECVAADNPFQFNPPHSGSGAVSYSLERAMLNCSEGFKRKELPLDGVKVIFEPNKTSSYVQWDTIALAKTTSEYCIGQKADNSYTSLICVPDIETFCDDDVCVTKCCGPEEVISGRSCELHTREFSPTFYTIQEQNISAPENYRLISWVPNCSHSLTIQFEQRDPYFLLSTGKLYLKDADRYYENSDYCLDYFLQLDAMIAYLCVEPPTNIQLWKKELLPYGMGISIFFLLVIIICHLITRHLRNVQGLCFLAYSTALFMSYIGFIINYKYTKDMVYSHCVFNALFSQFSLLAAFSWLCIMCFDIWRVIRSTVQCIPLSGILEKDREKFILYSAFGYGCPLLVTMVTAIMQSIPSNGGVVPGFGKESCWFVDDLSQWLYFYLIIALLNGTSLLMLGHILYMLCEADQGFSCFFRSSGASSRAFNRKHMSLFRQRLSLFSVMVICWFMEILSLEIDPKDLWVVTDILNTLQGLIVFIIFISSKKKRQQVKKAFKDKITFLSAAVTRSSVVVEDDLNSPETSGTSGLSVSGKEMAVITSPPERPPRQERNGSLEVKDHEDRRKDEGGIANGEEGAGGIINKGFDYQEDDGTMQEDNTGV